MANFSDKKNWKFIPSRITKVITTANHSVVSKWLSDFSIASASYSNSASNSSVVTRNVWKNLNTEYVKIANSKLTFLKDCVIQFTCTLKSYQLNTYYSTQILLRHNSSSILSLSSYMKGGQTISSSDTFTIEITAGDTLSVADWLDGYEDGDAKTWCTISGIYVIE